MEVEVDIKADVSLKAIFMSFARIGAMLFGGGYAMLPLLEREVVDRRKWCRWEEMADFYAMAQLVPGVLTINTTMLIGHRLRGALGSMAATAGVMLAPFVVIILYAAAFERMSSNHWLLSAMAGVRPAVAGMLAGVAFTMFNRSRRTRMGLAVSVVVVFLMLVCRINAVVIILGSVMTGIGNYFLVIRRNRVKHGDIH